MTDKKVKVTDRNGKDVTDRFEDKSEGNKIKMEAKKDALKKANFYGQDFTYSIEVEPNQDEDLSKFLKDGVPNKAEVSIDGDKKSSNTTHTNFEYIDPKVEKKVLTADKKELDDFIKTGEDFKYQVDYQLPLVGGSDKDDEKSDDESDDNKDEKADEDESKGEDDNKADESANDEDSDKDESEGEDDNKDEAKDDKSENMENPKDTLGDKKYELYSDVKLGDDLPDQLNLKGVKIMDGDKDVTDKGELNINKEDSSYEWTPKNPSDF